MSSWEPMPPVSPPPISYMTPRLDYRRPGILTAVGIISIVLGGFSALSSVGGIFSAIAYSMMSRITIPMPVPTTTPTTLTTSRMPRTLPTRPFTFGMSPRASLLTGVESFLSLIVAGLLIFAGIYMLRDSPRAGRMHWIYVVLKIPLIILAAIATWMTYTSLMSNFSASSPPISAALTNTMMIVPAVVSAFFSLLYPIALMIVLSTRLAKEHFQALQTAVQR